MPKLIHYRNKCIGCGICHEQQPEYWRMSKKDGKATLLRATLKKDVYVRTIPDTDTTKSREVIKACPVNIIRLS